MGSDGGPEQVFRDNLMSYQVGFCLEVRATLQDVGVSNLLVFTLSRNDNPQNFLTDSDSAEKKGIIRGLRILDFFVVADFRIPDSYNIFKGLL